MTPPPPSASLSSSNDCLRSWQRSGREDSHVWHGVQASSPHQCGPLAGPTTSHACTTLTHKVTTLQMASQMVSTLFLDITRGIKNVRSSALSHMLRSPGVSSYLVSCTSAFLEGSSSCLLFLGLHKVFSPVSVGTPQGSPVSPPPVRDICFPHPLRDATRSDPLLCQRHCLKGLIALLPKKYSAAPMAVCCDQVLECPPWGGILSTENRTDPLAHSTGYNAPLTGPSQPRRGHISAKVRAQVGQILDHSVAQHDHLLYENSGQGSSCDCRRQEALPHRWVSLTSSVIGCPPLSSSPPSRTGA